MVFVASIAGAEPPLAVEAEPAHTEAGPTELDAVPRLLLTPIAPVAFSFSEARSVVPEQWDGAPSTFRAEAIWIQEGSLTLRTIGASEAKLELDCRVTCRPMVEQSAAVELRLGLGSPGAAVPETYVFTRSRAIEPAQGFATKRPAATVQVGIGGLLNL